MMKTLLIFLHFLRREQYHIGVSILVAILMLVFDYWAMNSSITLGSEKGKLQIMEYVRQRLFGFTNSHISDSVLMIDVHYDKVFVTERTTDGTLEKGQVPVTDRKKLLRLLKYLQAHNDYNYVLLDIRLEASTRQPEDTALWNTISLMPRIVMARSTNAKLASPLLEKKTGAAQYNVALWETDFVKYPFYIDSIPSMALMMYREKTGYDVYQYGPLWIDRGRLARRSIIQTWDITNHQNRFYLGELLEELESGDDEDWDGNPSGKYILIGDFEDDIHPTFIGEIPGTLLIFNAYLSLLKQRHIVSPMLLIALFFLFYFMAWSTFVKKGFISWMCSFLGYSFFLTLFCFIAYLVFNEVYDILVIALLFTIFKTLVECYDNRNQIINIIIRIKNNLKRWRN